MNPLLPITTITGLDGIVSVGGVSLPLLVEKFGTPLYLYDSATISNAMAKLQGPLKEFYPGDFQIAYASKAYLSLKFARKIRELNCSIDVVSLSELKFALEAGFSPANIHLHGNNKSDEEIQLAVDKSIEAIVVDSLDELSLVEKISEKLAKKTQVWLRLNPDVLVDTHKAIQTGHSSSKFGIPIRGGQAEKAVLMAFRSKTLQLTGIHIHLGSQIFTPDPYEKALNQLLNFCNSVNWQPEVISPGGGWGIPYVKETVEVDPSIWIQTITASIKKWSEKGNRELPRLVIEPGRWLVARAGLAIYRVGVVKETLDGEIIAALDGGMADNPRPSMYGAQYSAEIIGETKDRLIKNVRLVGRYCESGDELIKNISIAMPRMGDLIAVPVSGAYQLSMASNYNLADRPAVLWLENGKYEILQNREKACDAPWWRGD